MKKYFIFVVVLLLSCCCFSSQNDAPKVIFNLHAQPFPDVPFPNDILTKEDETSWTGKRINIPVDGLTSAERRIKEKLNTLQGFSTYAPIFVSFTKPLDILNIKKRQLNFENFKEHSVYLFCADEKSRNFGKPVFLDFGHGNFPVFLEETQLFLNDTRASSSNVLFETEDEEALGKDTNFDGRIFKPNILPRDGDQYSDLITFYDMNTNTLIFRPIFPLEEETKYIVILTKKLIGENGKPIVSPFDEIFHPQQRNDIEKFLKKANIRKYGVKRKDIAFAWCFTTQPITRDLVAIREGLYNIGQFKKLSEEFPVKDAISLHRLKSKGNPYIMEVKSLLKILKNFLPSLGVGEEALADFNYVDYLVSGSIRVPYFLTNQTDYDFYSEEIFNINSKTGEYKVKSDEVTFLLSVPKQTEKIKPPFPVVFVVHGYGGGRLTLLPVCGILAKYGFAAIALDSVGHGIGGAKKEIEKYMPMIEGVGMSDFIQALMQGRDRDLNGDGIGDSGGDYWTAYVFHTRDVVRQTVVDYMQVMRVLKSFDGKNTWNLTESKIAGDFNDDGVPDIGGPDNYYSIIGGSLGGIISSVVSAVEPSITVAVPIVGGGGFSDIGVRSLQGGVPQAVTLRILGPLVVNIKKDGDDYLAFQVTDVNRESIIPFAKIKSLKEGDIIILKNETKNIERYCIVNQDNKLRISFPSDTGDKISIKIFDSNRNLKQEITTYEIDAKYQERKFRQQDQLVSPTEGFGIIRNTPEYRYFFIIAQTVLDPSDPINYAKHHFLSPLDIKPEGKVAKNILFIPTAGDMNVPVNTGIALARASGLLPITRKEAEEKHYYYGNASLLWNEAKSYTMWLSSKMNWRKWTKKYKKYTTPNQIMIDLKIIEGLEKLTPLADADDLSFGRSGFGQKTLSPPLRIIRKTKVGVSGLRTPYVIPSGSHGFNVFSPPEYKGVKSNFHLGKYIVNQIGHYILSRGQILFDDECLEKGNCKINER